MESAPMSACNCDVEAGAFFDYTATLRLEMKTGTARGTLQVPVRGCLCLYEMNAGLCAG